MAQPAVAQPFTLPVEDAFGRFLQGFFGEIIPDTPAVAEFAARPFAKAAAWVPGRMVDAAEDMLAAYRANDTSGAARATPLLPVILAAASRDYIPLGEDLGRIAAEPMYCQIPGDPKGRLFKLRAAACEIRIQLAFVAVEKHTARSLAMQFQMYCTRMANRSFPATYILAGLPQQWPVQVERPEIMAQAVPLEVKNLTILTADLNLRATIPMLGVAPTGDAGADGLGTNPVGDPSGWMPVHEIDGFGRADTLAGAPTSAWVAP
jgi:hypothetical protein